MVRVQNPREERERFMREARKEGMALSRWLRTAAHKRLDRQKQPAVFESTEEIDAFFHRCAQLAGPGSEPNWGAHLRVIDESRRRGAPCT